MARFEKVKELKLVPNLIPAQLWGLNARRFGRTLWKKMRSDALEAAHHACEACSDAPSPIYGDRLTCHEVWRYDDKRRFATLVGLRMQCTKCDSAVHMDMTTLAGEFKKAIAQLCKVNGIGPLEAKELFDAAMVLWEKRSKKKWRIVVAKPLLKRYPKLAALESKKRIS